MQSKSSSTEKAKQLAGQTAAQFVHPDMLIGLGTGSTTSYFIEALGEKCKKGLKIQAVATSKQSEKQAQQLGITLIDSSKVSYLDLIVDGADEIDPLNQMIKGGGGALLREKLLAYASNEMIVIVDQKKLVSHLGTFLVPLEVSSFIYQTTLKRLEKLGYQSFLRLKKNKGPIVTDNGNFIIDIHYSFPILDAAFEHYRLKAVVGVLETGLFFNLAKKVIIGYEDETVKFR